MAKYAIEMIWVSTREVGGKIVCLCETIDDAEWCKTALSLGDKMHSYRVVPTRGE